MKRPRSVRVINIAERRWPAEEHERLRALVDEILDSGNGELIHALTKHLELYTKIAAEDYPIAQ